MNSNIPGRYNQWILSGTIVIGVLALSTWWLLRRVPQQPSEAFLRDQLVFTNGALHKKDDPHPFTGFMIERYSDGALLSRSAVSNGLLDGLSEGWHTNGIKQVEEHFKAGVSHGRRTKWYPNGQKQSEVTIKDGKLDGTFHRWHENGVLAEEIFMRLGSPEGTSLSYYPDGSLKARATLTNGRVSEQKFWKPGEQFPSNSPVTASPANLPK